MLKKVPLIVLLFAGLLFSCKTKTEQTEVPLPVEPKPVVAEAQPVQEPEKPVVVEEESDELTEMDLQRFQFENIHFDFDKSDLREEERMKLDTYAQVLKENPTITVLIEGHCDERGTIEYNQALGERRAERIRLYLVGLGIGESRLRTVSYGKLQPLDPSQNEEAWAKNRRGQFRLGLLK